MFERKLYRIILFMTSLISIISIIGNLLTSLPLIINIKWVVLMLVSLIGYVKERKDQKSDTYKFLYFFFVIAVFIPIGYVDSGDVTGTNSSAYMFLFMLCSVYLFKGIERYSLVILNIGSFMVLRTVGYHIPTFVRLYTDRMIFLDQLIQIPLVLIACLYIIKGNAKAYEEKKNELEDEHSTLQMVNEKLETLAVRDMLTGLYNRKSFDSALAKIQKHELMASEEIYVVIFNLDDFKQINNSLGHIAGDKVLREFSSTLNEMINEPHIISRWGGDEFSIIYRGKKEQLENLIFEIKHSYLQVVRKLRVSSSVNFGFLQWHKEDNGIEIMRKASKALYNSKIKNKKIV